MRVEGPSQASGLAWTILCVPNNKALIELPLGTVGKDPVAGAFAVPAADCPAQALELRGRPANSEAIEQFKIFNLSLKPLAAAP